MRLTRKNESHATGTSKSTPLSPTHFHTCVQGDFLGMISRANVIKAIEENGPDATGISLERYIEVAPIVIPPNMPLPFIYRIVQAEGINYLPVVRNYGPLAVS